MKNWPLISPLAFVLCVTVGCSADIPAESEAAAQSTPTAAPPAASPATSEQAAEQELPGDEETADQALVLPPLPGDFAKPWQGDLDGMIERRVVRVLTVYSAGRYYLDGAGEKGLTYELFKGYENFLNEKLNRGHLKVHVVFVPLARNQLIPALLAGRGDVVAASLTITEDRQQEVDFSKPVSKEVAEILVSGPSAPAVNSIDDLAGQTLYVRESSSYHESLETLNERFVAEGKAPIRIEPISEALEDDDLIEMVNSGLLPWIVVDSYKTHLWDGVFTDLKVHKDIVFNSGGRMGWAFRKNSPQLAESLNEFLLTHKQGTLMGNILVNRYIRDFDWAANALAADDYKRLQDLAHIFRKYGEQYGMDYLMAAAQGYQESRLRQDARSHAGAVGVMQLLPTTAADPKVGIEDIHLVDPNIHAGVKYMRFLRDRYFNDPGISEMNQHLLALGAYNAGPRRMINLRAEAEKTGYDPNIWFDNVEVIAAKRIGRETVQYVANIYKYYLAYRMTIEQQLNRMEAREKAGIHDE